MDGSLFDCKWEGGNNGCSTSVSMIIIVLVFLLSVMGSAKRFQKEDIL